MNLKGDTRVGFWGWFILLLIVIVVLSIPFFITNSLGPFFHFNKYQWIALSSSIFSLFSASAVKFFLTYSSDHNNKHPENPDALCSLVKCMNCYQEHVKGYIASKESSINNDQCNIDDINNGIAYEITLHSFSFFAQLLSLLGLLSFKMVADNFNGLSPALIIATLFIIGYAFIALGKNTEFHYKLYLCPDSNKAIYNLLLKYFPKKLADFFALNIPPARVCLTIVRLLVFILSVIATLKL